MSFYNLNVLIFPAGNELGLEINDALRFSGHVKIYGVNSIRDYSSIDFDYLTEIPSIYEPSFIDLFKKFIKDHSIDIIFPTHDSVVELLSNIDTGSYVINDFPNTAQICRSKIRTFN